MAIHSDDTGASIVATAQPASLTRSSASDRVCGVTMATDGASYDANTGNTARQDPTVLAYGHLVVAYKFFNERLFGGALPGCLITMQRKKGARGFFHGGRWQRQQLNRRLHMRRGSTGSRRESAARRFLES